jgi:hypothetical protein
MVAFLSSPGTRPRSLENGSHLISGSGPIGKDASFFTAPGKGEVGELKNAVAF